MHNFKKTRTNRTPALLILLGASMLSSAAHALGDQWYIGLGGSGTWLQPNPVEPGVDVTTRQGVGGNVFFGVDLDQRSSAQLTFYSLGEAEVADTEMVPYQAADASVLYRVYDTKDKRLRRGGVSLALYGRFALGYMNRDTDIPLSNDAAVYFGAGGGAEIFLTNNFSMRVEGMYHDRDAASASFQLVARFGGAPRAAARPAPPPTPTLSAPQVPEAPVPETPAQPSVPVVPAPTVPSATVPTPSLSGDTDGDSVPDSADQCANSAAGFPVRSNGCALFDGVLSGIKFATGTSQLLPGATNQLDFLANVLSQYPQAKVELHSHTDDKGSVRDQAILTRARLREVGIYLVRKGVRSNRLVLRSFGGTRPLYDNGTPEGVDANNRIEVFEKSN